MSTNVSSPALEEAIAMLQRGETVQAEQRMRRHVEQAEKEYGRGTKQVAAAQYELARCSCIWGKTSKQPTRCGRLAA